MKRNYYIVALIMLTFFVISFVTNVIGPLVPDIINGFNLSLTLVALLPFAFFIAYGVMSIPSGMLIEKYNEKKIEKLLNDAGIIRNRLKIDAAIENAKKILELQKEFGSFKNWLEHHYPLSKEEWVKLFKKHFRFTGGEIVNEFLMSTGYLPGAHVETCTVYKKIEKLKPMWMKK